MYILLDDNNVVVQTQPNPQDGFIKVDFAIAGQVMQEDGSFIDPPSQAVPAEQVRYEAMHAGVLIDGVMCSALKEDQWGLNSIKAFVLAGTDVPFKFVNGNTLTLTSSNIAAFEAAWIPFRFSFF